MNINADAILSYILVAVGGFLIKYLWDKMVENGKKKSEKAEAYDKKVLREVVEDIVKESCMQFKSGLEESINEFKAHADAEFKRYSEMYWKAVGNLEDVEKNFKHLREQDLAFYKYQLINSCKKYISQGFITQYQFDRLSELHKIYHDLGGNSQGDMYYEKATQLKIISDNSYKAIDQMDDELYVTEADMKDPHVKKEEEQ